MGAEPEVDTDLEGSALRAGAGSFLFDLEVPENYRINPTAPFSLTASGDGEVVAVQEEPAFRVETAAPRFPLAIPLRLRPGRGWLRIRLSVYFCELPEERLCFYQSRRLRVPITVLEGGASCDAGAVYRMELPSAPI